jgi:hypothetical protein
MHRRAQALNSSSGWNLQEVSELDSFDYVSLTSTVIIVFHVLGTTKAAEQHASPPFDMEQLPDLMYFLDIMWSQWKFTCDTVTKLPKPSVKDLRRIFFLNIENDEMKQIIKRALNSKNRTLGQWPGAAFLAHQPAGMALLGMWTKLNTGRGL